MKKSNRPYTQETFAFAARAYLERFPCSSARFEDVLRRKFMNKRQTAEEGWIKTALDFGLENGFLNDTQYAQGVFDSLMRKGLPAFQIGQKMRLKQIDKTIIERLLATIPSDEAAQREAITIFARRKRLGIYRIDSAKTPDPKKEYDKLRRAGFPHDLTIWVLGQGRD